MALVFQFSFFETCLKGLIKKKKTMIFDIYDLYEDILFEGVDNKGLITWDKTKRLSMEGQQGDYFDRIEDLFNVAVLHCALAIEFAIGSYTSCEEKSNEDPQEDLALENLNSLRDVEVYMFSYFVVAAVAPFVIPWGVLRTVMKK